MKVLLLGSEGLGRGDDDLGAMILANFLRLLAESKERPQTIICWNVGVRLVAEGSWCLPHLKRLEDIGVEILACGTCVEYLELKDKIAVGKVSTMPVFIDKLLHNDVISV
ncbi:MAG: hypothetical protein M1136_09045 [Chloroflexi bacterium]|nr:hypothetical protein [Chloroflexota bacterium]